MAWRSGQPRFGSSITRFRIVVVLLCALMVSLSSLFSQPVDTKPTAQVPVTSTRRPAAEPVTSRVDDDPPVPSGPVDGEDPPPRALRASEAQLRVITVQTTTSPGWCRMMKSAALSGITVESLGWGQSYEHRKRPRWIVDWIDQQQRRAFTPKPTRGPRTAQPALGAHGFDEDPAALHDEWRNTSRPAVQTVWRANRKLDDWDVIMFLDGSDTAFTGDSPSTILSRFTGLVKSDVEPALAAESALPEQRRQRRWKVPLLFNAEANCYHHQLYEGAPWGVMKGKCIVAYKKYNPYVQTKWRYLNAGGWIGYVWAVKRFFAKVTKALDAKPKLWCDQSLIGGMLLTRKFERLIHLDYANAFFLPTYHLDPQNDFCNTADPKYDDPKKSLHDDNRMLRLCHSGALPSVFHFNGRAEGGGGASVKDLLMKTAWWVRTLMPNGAAWSESVLQSWEAALHDGTQTRYTPLQDVCRNINQLP